MRLQQIWFFVFLINHTGGLSVNISPKPVAVDIGDDLIVTSTIIKTESESWKAFLFYVNDNETNSACRGAFYDPSKDCKDIFGCASGFGFTCNYTHFNLEIDNVRSTLIGLTIYAEVTFDGSSKVNSDSTIIKLKIPLNSVSLIPTGTITVKEKETHVFQCSATSLPTAGLSWHVSGSTLTTSSPPVITADSVSSNYTYTAQKNNNGKRISCKAVYESTSFSADALLNILYAPSVTVSPKYNAYNVIENTTNFELNCTVTGANPAVKSYRWYKDGLIISTAATYILSKVQRSNTGNYTCDATNSVNSSDPSSASQVNVLYGIELYPIRKKEYQEGRQLSITCNGQSKPAIKDNDVKLTKQNNNTFNRKGKQLIINDVNKVDRGTYVCSVVIQLTPTVGLPVNVTGTTSVDVDILYIPIVSTSPTLNPYNVIENTPNVNMTCRVTDSNPPATSFRWYKDNSVIGTTETYTIERMNRSHSGRYSCDATNSVGVSSQSSEFTLNVLYGVIVNHINKQQPHEGEELIVPCNGQSNPVLTDDDITWTKQNNNTFQKTGKQLVIKNVNRLDSGNYICNAVIKLLPSIGSAAVVIGTTIVPIDVIYRPSVVVSPYHNPFNVIENKTNLQLTCAVIESKPPVTSFRWYKDGSIISTTASYTIPIVKQSSSGRYTCDATNDVGSSGLSTSLKLNVLYGVTVVSISKQEPTEGNELFITCDAHSNPAYTENDVSWTKEYNTTFKQSRKHLVISNINRFDIGTFTCKVTLTLTPSIGQSVVVQGTTNVEIDVLFKPMIDGSKISTDKLIGVPRNADTHITIHILANPVPLMQWIFIHGIDMSICCNNTIASNNTFNGKYISSSIHISGQMGKYVIISENSVGVFSQVFTVELEGKPKSPLIICVFCKSTSATVVWLQEFNGGQLQTFRVVYYVKERNLGNEMSDEIEENETYPEMTYTVNDLKPHTKYTFYVVSTNDFGNTRSKMIECSTDDLNISSEDTATQYSKVLESGIAMLTIGLFAVLSSVVFVVYHYLRKKKFASKSSSHTYTGIRASNRALSSSYDAVEECGDEKKLSQEQTDTSFNTYEECGAYSNTPSQIDKNVMAGSTSNNKKGGAYDNSINSKKADTEYDNI